MMLRGADRNGTRCSAQWAALRVGPCFISLGLGLVLGCVPAGLAATSAIAGSGPGLWGSIGLNLGATQPDGTLSKYRWDTDRQRLVGVRAMLGLGRFAVGARYSMSSTDQGLGVLGADSRPDVDLKSYEAVVQVDLISWLGCRLSASGTYGDTRISYDPDVVALDLFGSGDPTVIELRPIESQTAGYGLGLRRNVLPGVGVGVQVDRSFFEMATAHRSGEVILIEEERFWQWNARAELAWTIGVL